MRIGNIEFKHVTAIDFEFKSDPGENPKPICLVTRNIETGLTQRYWEDDFREMSSAPYPIGADSLTLAYYASAEMGCFIQLGWPYPKNLLDIFTEFRCLTNNKSVLGNSLLDALAWHEIDGIGFSEKKEMRLLAMRGGPYSSQERIDLLEYCESDVIAVQKLFFKMLPNFDLPRALLRGRYMKAVAQIENNGIPVDILSLQTLEINWPKIQTRLIEKVDTEFKVFDGSTFKMSRFAQYLANRNIVWPRLPSGQLELKEETFENMSKIHPELFPLYELRIALSQMRLGKLPVGTDCRNRTLLSPFKSITGRNQPRTTNFIFGRSAWFRHLIQPKKGFALAYVDWSQQEFGIAAGLSGDPAMIAAYISGDPYLEFGKQSGIIPQNGTKITHEQQREQFKQCALAVLYGGGASLVAMRTKLSLFAAKELILAHKKSYQIFWKWIASASHRVNLGGNLYTVFGWLYYFGKKTKPGTILNFPMQANGAEMMRLAACRLVEEGIKVCAPIHDAFLIEAEELHIENAVLTTQRIMAEVSGVILDQKLVLRSDVKIISHPERYVDKRGIKMWNTVQAILKEIGVYAHDPRNIEQNLPYERVPALSPSMSLLENNHD